MLKVMELIEAKNTALSYLKPAIKETLKWFRTDIVVERKGDKSPVTIADRNTEEMLRRQIQRDFPGHGIIGEEFGNELPTAEWVWTIDPIDGTRSFIRGLPFYSILLSLLHHGRPVMGVIALPALGEVYWAVQGQGTWTENRRVFVSPEKKLEKCLVATADIYCFEKKKYTRLFKALNRDAAMVRTYPDAFGHLLAIHGAVDVMVDPWAYIWDYAPCKILVEEAGGVFSNFTGNKNSITEGTAIVGNKSLVQKIRKMVRG